jgi:hypothetical protein
MTGLRMLETPEQRESSALRLWYTDFVGRGPKPIPHPHFMHHQKSDPDCAQLNR